MYTCYICKEFIHESVMKVDEFVFHEKCLQCHACKQQLERGAFLKRGKVYCKSDYLSISHRCDGCLMPIDDGEYIMKSKDCTYHQNCFKCANCDTLIHAGQQFTHVESDLFCAVECTHIKRERTDEFQPIDFQLADHDTVYGLDEISNDNSDTDSLGGGVEQKHQDASKKMCQSSKRPRTILNQAQRKLFKAAFEATPKPCRKVRDKLAMETGLSQRVVQVWFQNQRAKIKKLSKRQKERWCEVYPQRNQGGFFQKDMFMSPEANWPGPGTGYTLSSLSRQLNEPDLVTYPPGLATMPNLVQAPPPPPIDIDQSQMLTMSPNDTYYVPHATQF